MCHKITYLCICVIFLPYILYPMPSLSLPFFNAFPFFFNEAFSPLESSISFSFADLTTVESSCCLTLIFETAHLFLPLFCFSNYLSSFRLLILLVLFPPSFIFSLSLLLPLSLPLLYSSHVLSLLKQAGPL